MVKVHINNTKHITIAKHLYTSSRQHIYTLQNSRPSIQHITNISHSVLTGDLNAHSTLWHSYTDDHREQLIADVISNSDHITLKTQTRVPNTTLQQTSSPDITTVSNTLYNRTLWTTQHTLSSDHLPIITTINIRHDYRLQQNRRIFTNCNLQLLKGGIWACMRCPCLCLCWVWDRDTVSHLPCVRY